MGKLASHPTLSFQLRLRLEEATLEGNAASLKEPQGPPGHKRWLGNRPPQLGSPLSFFLVSPVVLLGGRRTSGRGKLLSRRKLRGPFSPKFGECRKEA